MLTCLGFLAVPPPDAPYCAVAKPIYWSAHDTRATKAQADRENRKWKRLCGAEAAKAP